MTGKRRHPQRVFLNVPYDGTYEPLFVALVGGLVCLGREPSCALQAADAGDGRLKRIIELVTSSNASIHDLSRVQVQRRGVPRFNMPFELGLCCAVAAFRNKRHPYYVFEAKAYRLQKSLSDLGGYDPQVHGGTQRGVLRSLLNCFGTRGTEPTVPELERATRRLNKAIPGLKRDVAARTAFEPAVFRRMVATATLIAIEEGLIEEDR